MGQASVEAVECSSVKKKQNDPFFQWSELPSGFPAGLLSLAEVGLVSVGASH